MDLLSVCMVHRNVLYLCAGVRRAHTWCLWGVDLSLGSGWLWSEWRALIFKHMLLRERDCKWFMIYTVVSQLKRSTLGKDSLIPPCLCALLSSRSYMARLSSCIQPARLMSFSWLFHSFLIFSPIKPSHCRLWERVKPPWCRNGRLEFDVYIRALLYQGLRATMSVGPSVPTLH